MRTLLKKLKSESGASIILALGLMLICVMVAAVIMVAAASGASRNVNRTAQQQAYLAVSSAAQLVMDEMKEAGEFVGVANKYDYGCNNADAIMLDGIKMTITDERCTDVDYTREMGAHTIPNTCAVSGLLLRACEEIYIDRLPYYEESFTIRADDARLPEAACDFRMDADFNISMHFTTADSDYAVTVNIQAETQYGDPQNPMTIYCENQHAVSYDIEELDGSIRRETGMRDIPGSEYRMTATVKWPVMTLEKGDSGA